jgi:hypothetical protein
VFGPEYDVYVRACVRVGVLPGCVRGIGAALLGRHPSFAPPPVRWGVVMCPADRLPCALAVLGVPLQVRDC